MKIRRFSRVELFLFSSPFLFLSLLLGGQQWKHHILYPSSDVFINPYDEEYDPELEKYVSPMVSVAGQTVDVNVGDAPSDVIKSAVLQYLSPVIRMHPNENDFCVRWAIIYPYSDFELHYDRKVGSVTEVQTSQLPPFTRTSTVLGKHITDRDIHEAATSNKDYDVWGTQHWK
jgi:hypothetical protein